MQNRKIIRSHHCLANALLVAKIHVESLEHSFIVEFQDLDFAGCLVTFNNNKLFRYLSSNINQEVDLTYQFGKNGKEIPIQSRVVWVSDKSEKDKFCCGFEFYSQIENFESEVFIDSHPDFKPNITSNDPLDLYRKLLFTIEGISPQYLRLKSSLSNKHLLNGMIFTSCTLNILDYRSSKLDFKIVSTSYEANGQFSLIIKLISPSDSITKELRKYAYSFGKVTKHNTIREVLGFEKGVRNLINYKIVSSEQEYQKVLELRFDAYKHKNKLGSKTTLSEFGTSYKHEGTIIYGTLNNEVICSFELISQRSNVDFWFRRCLKLETIPGVPENELLEVNKFSISPLYHRTDVLLSLFQQVHFFSLLDECSTGVLSCTDSLKSTYIKIGAVDSKIRRKHPSIENEFLNIMLIPKDVYLKSENLSAFAWAFLYEKQNELAINLGFIEKAKLSLPKRIGIYVFNKIIRKRNES